MRSGVSVLRNEIFTFGITFIIIFIAFYLYAYTRDLLLVYILDFYRINCEILHRINASIYNVYVFHRTVSSPSCLLSHTRPVYIGIVHGTDTLSVHITFVRASLLHTLASGEPRAPHSKHIPYPRRNSYNGSRRNCGISKARIASTGP